MLLGPFSSALTIPTSAIAEKYRMAFVEGAGGAPGVFSRRFHYVFFVQPAVAAKQADPFVDYILSLPADKRPKTAAYPELDDPFAAPIAEAVRQKFEAAGIRTVYKTVYPAETADFSPIVSKMANAHPDIVVGGTQVDDAFAEVKAMIEQKFSPKLLFLSNGSNDPVNFPDKVGANNVEGIFGAGDWFEDENSPGNTEFVAAYHNKYGTGPIDATSAEAYACGQILQAVVEKLHSLSNSKIIDALHQGSWPSVEGNLSWDNIGQPQGEDLLVEWVGGKLLPVYPQSIALHDPVIPKPNWGG